ncbi:hypothetical protein RYX36_006803, partial [Vicia faba]
METLDANSSSSSSLSPSSSSFNSDDNNGSVTWYGMRLPFVNPFLSPLTFLLDYSGVLRSTNDSEAVVVNNRVSGSGSELRSRVDTDSATSVAGSSAGEVAIRIIGAGESIQNHVGELGYDDCGEDLIGERSGNGMPALDDDDAGSRGGIEASEGVPLVSSSSSSSLAGSGRVDGDASVNGSENNNRDSSSYQRYDIQLVAKWIEQILPFSLLLLVVFIRQHLQGFFVTIWIAAVMFKSNEIVKKQTALKGDRKVSLLAGISVAFILHVIGIYWWYRNDDILYPLVMLPPNPTPFWHAIFTILVNDILMRQVAMAFKCILLIYYKKGKGHNFRRQVINAFHTQRYQERKFIMGFMQQRNRLLLLVIYVLYARRRCIHLSYCVANTFSAKIVYLSGLREKGLALSAEHWLKQPIFGPSEMDQLVYFSSCFNKPRSLDQPLPR